ncbi:hypothetical protein PENTCL1PPCAC_21812, partial [Pristionchus entomophagus]
SRMRSSSPYFHPPHRSKSDRFVLGPVIYQDNSDDINTRSSRRPNQSFTDRTNTCDVSSDIVRPSHLSGRSPSKSSRSGKKSKKSKASKGSRKCKKEKKKSEYNAEECPIQREKRDAEYLREKSNYEKRKREKIIELAKKAEKEHDKLMVQRTRAQQTTKEIESSMDMEEDVRNRSMAKMKNQVEGMDWRSSRDLKDVRREIAEWKGKTAMSGELAKRLDKVEKRLDVLEKTDAERKKTMEMVDKNWAEFNRMKTQSMALEITQIKNRRGASHLNRMPEDVAKTTANNLYKLCSDLHLLSFHLNHKTDLTRLVDEALTLAEAIAPLYGHKEEFNDSRENTSSTNVSLSNLEATSPGSAPTSPTAPIRSSLRKSGRDPATVSIPPLSKFDPKYSMKENQHIDATSLREKSSNYYSDKEFAAQAAKEAQANCEPVPVVPQTTPPPLVAPPPTLPPVAPVAAPPTVQQPAAPAAETTPATAPAAAAAPTAAPEAPPTPTEAPAVPAAAPTPAAPAAAPPAAAPDGPSPASISLSVDSDRDSIQKEKKKKRSRMRSEESSDTSTAEEPKPE